MEMRRRAGASHACIVMRLRRKPTIKYRTYGQISRIATVELFARLVAPYNIGISQPGNGRLGDQLPGAENRRGCCVSEFDRAKSKGARGKPPDVPGAGGGTKGCRRERRGGGGRVEGVLKTGGEMLRCSIDGSRV